MFSSRIARSICPDVMMSVIDWPGSANAGSRHHETQHDNDNKTKKSFDLTKLLAPVLHNPSEIRYCRNPEYRIRCTYRHGILQSALLIRYKGSVWLRNIFSH